MSVVWKPQPGPQTDFLKCPYQELIFTGARGSGKTDAMIADALLHCDKYPGANALMVRLTYTESEDLLKRIHEMAFPLGGKRNIVRKQWSFPNGSILSVMQVQTNEDAMRGQGGNRTWLGCDELGKYPSPQPIDMLRASVRSATETPTYFRWAANPGGPGHEWIAERYLAPTNFEPFVPFDLRFTENDVPVRCMRIASVTDDNVILMENSPKYKDNIRMSVANKDLRHALLYDDWSMSFGSYFSAVWDREKHMIEPFEIPVLWKHWRAMDYGYQSPCSVGWYTQDPMGTIIRYRELYLMDPRDWDKGAAVPVPALAEMIRKAEIDDQRRGVKWTWSVADMPGSNGIITVQDELNRCGVRFDRLVRMSPRTYRVDQLQELTTRLYRTSRGADMGFQMFDTCEQAAREIENIQPDPAKPEDVNTKQRDHAVDEILMSMQVTGRRAPKDLPPPVPGERRVKLPEHMPEEDPSFADLLPDPARVQ